MCARGGDEIAVTAREFALLEFLMRHRGDVVSKRAILDNVWDMHFDGDHNIVEVYVSYLRKKIDQPFGRPADRDRPRRRLPRSWPTVADRDGGP